MESAGINRLGYNLSSLLDVYITNAASGNIIQYNGQGWTNSDITHDTMSGKSGIGPEYYHLNLSQYASASQYSNENLDGLLSHTDWNIFNNKQTAFSSGSLTESISNILTITGGTNSVIGSGTSVQVTKATGSTSGYLSNTDWNIFYNKQDALNGNGFIKASGSLISYDDSTYLTENQTITLNGVISGSGSTNIVTSSGSGYYIPTEADQAHWNGLITFPGFGTDHVTAAYGDHTHANLYESIISTGSISQYWKGDKTWQTLDKSAVGLGSVENTTLSTWVGSNNITTLGTISNKVHINVPGEVSTGIPVDILTLEIGRNTNGEGSTPGYGPSILFKDVGASGYLNNMARIAARYGTGGGSYLSFYTNEMWNGSDVLVDRMHLTSAGDLSLLTGSINLTPLSYLGIWDKHNNNQDVGVLVENTNAGSKAATTYALNNDIHAVLEWYVYSSGYNSSSDARTFKTSLFTNDFIKPNWAQVVGFNTIEGLIVNTAGSYPLLLGTGNYERIRIDGSTTDA
ncbi:MAG: hypothetical protein M0R17_01425, partial [Candidatus Omnitrophica bacterium]|nr:hypothetical protein [Candidatus Omnitrophota bacterium]